MENNSENRPLPNTDPRFLKPYDAKDVEDRIYAIWEKSGYFNPDKCIEDGVTQKNAPYFSMVLPPPNVTGTLHMGSAFMLAIEDIMVRFNRMSGKRTLWIPGTDHAAIATQAKVESLIYKKENKRRHDIGREELLKRIKQYASESHDTIVKQIRKTGCSIDWSREAFTLDEKRNLAVKTAFKKMYDDGLVYRGFRIINWDPKGQTTISDDEVVYQSAKTKFYTFRYSKHFPIAIATTRPETKVGDTAVAVNPLDKRYKDFIGQDYDIDFAGVKLHIKIVADDSVDMEFGTGAVGVTPAHSAADWEMAERHKLPIIPVINEFARMSVETENLKDKKVAEAREIIVEWLKSENLLEKEEEIEHNIATAERTGGIIEPLPKLQWFVNVNKKIKLPHSNIPGISSGKEYTLKDLMLAPVKKNSIKIIPDRFEKVYIHWVENLHDWCISRQIWYGHRIPIWYKGEDIYCDVNPPEGVGWIQDEDTLDTWFSSGMWTFSTMGWPEKTTDLANYHPTSVIETGYDILFIWVIKMVMMSTYLVGEIPFKIVYLHGLVRDKDGKKISKSLGNNIDPTEVIEKFGADAMRMSLLVGTGPGNDSKMSEEKLKAYKHFANKLWNVARYVLSNTDGSEDELKLLQPNEKNIYTQFLTFANEMTADMENYRLHIAAEKIYHYIWHTFADVIIEISKPVIFGDDETAKISSKCLLNLIFRDSLKLLHPFMPYVTEEIWSLYSGKKQEKLLMIEKWPVPENK